MATFVRYSCAIVWTCFIAACGSSAPEVKSPAPVSTAANENAAPKTSAPEDDFSAWVGAYPFEETAPGFAWSYEVKIEKKPEGYRALFDLVGYQASEHLICTLRSAGPNKIDLLYLREGEENLSGPREANEHLLSLERLPSGRVEYRWAAIQPNLQPRPEGPAELGDANAYVKKYPIDFLEVKPVKARLEKLLGKGEAKRLDEFIGTQQPITKNGDLLVMEGFFPHSGGSQKALVLYDMKVDKLHVLFYDEDETKTLDVYSEAWVGLPKLVDETIKDWTEPGIKVVRHK